MNDLDDLLDINQAALFLQVSETSLRRWTRSGRLPCLRVGMRRERRFRRADLLAFLEVEPAQAANRSRAHTAGQPDANHYCGFYSSDHGRAAMASDFLSEGLDRGAFCYLVATPPARVSILAYLHQARPTIPDETSAGRLVQSEYHATPAAQYEYYEHEFASALAHGAKSIRVLGDVSNGSLSVGKPFTDVNDYEAGFDRRIGKRFPVTKLCLYDARQVSGMDMLGALKCHPYTLSHPIDKLLA